MKFLKGEALSVHLSDLSTAQNMAYNELMSDQWAEVSGREILNLYMCKKKTKKMYRSNFLQSSIT
jgi:hypothetical protein